MWLFCCTLVLVFKAVCSSFVITLLPHNRSIFNINKEKRVFIKRAWNGQIAVWKSVVLVSIFGYILTFAAVTAINMALLQMKLVGWIDSYSIVFMKISTSMFFLIFGIFATRSLWKSANNSKVKIGHALARFWAICLGLYIAGVIIRLLSIV